MKVTANNEVRVNANVQTSKETDQLAFERFCEFCNEGYFIQVQLKSKKTDNASFHITAFKANEEREEIRLFLNQEILDLVLNYLNSGKLENTSKVNPNDLGAFNEGGIEFKKELFQAERKKGKEIVWSYTALEKLASLHYNYGTITFYPYPTQDSPAIQARKKIGETTYRLPASYLLEDSFTHKINRKDRLTFIG